MFAIPTADVCRSLQVRARRQGSDSDDPTVIRHLHDLAALTHAVATASYFQTLVRKAAAHDEGGKGSAAVGAAPEALVTGILEQLSTGRLWAEENEDPVDAVSFASPNERIGFDQALASLTDLVTLLGTAGRGRLPATCGQPPTPLQSA